jgi:hypothetical protein
VEEEEQEAHRQFVTPRTKPPNSAKTAKKASVEETVSLSKKKQSPKKKPPKANGASTAAAAAAAAAKHKKRSASDSPRRFTDEGEDDDEEEEESDKSSSGDDNSSDRGDGDYVPKKKNEHVPSKKVSVEKKKESEDGIGSLSSSSSSSLPSSSKKARGDEQHLKKSDASVSPENSAATSLAAGNGAPDTVDTCASDMSKMILSHKNMDPIKELGFFVYVMRALEEADPDIVENSVIANCARAELKRVLDVKLHLAHAHDYIKMSLVAHLTEIGELLKAPAPDSEPLNFSQLLRRLSKIAKVIDILLPCLSE